MINYPTLALAIAILLAGVVFIVWQCNANSREAEERSRQYRQQQEMIDKANDRLRDYKYRGY